MLVRKYLLVRACVVQEPVKFAVRVFPGGCFRTDFSCLIFLLISFLIIGSILKSQGYQRAQMFLFYLPTPIDSVSLRASVGIFNAFKFQTQVKSNMENP